MQEVLQDCKEEQASASQLKVKKEKNQEWCVAAEFGSIAVSTYLG